MHLVQVVDCGWPDTRLQDPHTGIPGPDYGRILLQSHIADEWFSSWNHTAGRFTNKSTDKPGLTNTFQINHPPTNPFQPRIPSSGYGCTRTQSQFADENFPVWPDPSPNHRPGRVIIPPPALTLPILPRNYQFPQILLLNTSSFLRILYVLCYNFVEVSFRINILSHYVRRNDLWAD